MYYLKNLLISIINSSLPFQHLLPIFFLKIPAGCSALLHHLPPEGSRNAETFIEDT